LLSTRLLDLLVAIDNAAPESVGMGTTSFEPVLDVPALGTFLVISIVFAALNFRTSQIQKVVQERNYWLEQVRDLKSKELAGDTVEESVLQNALGNYESAVVKEEQLRNLVPGVVRISPPSTASEADEKAAAMAKQFLGKDYDIGTGQRKDAEGDGKLPTIALAVLAVIFLAQMSLFVFMNLSDPMTGGSMM
jgi:hypothetical protein